MSRDRETEAARAYTDAETSPKRRAKPRLRLVTPLSEVTPPGLDDSMAKAMDAFDAHLEQTITPDHPDRLSSEPETNRNGRQTLEHLLNNSKETFAAWATNPRRNHDELMDVLKLIDAKLQLLSSPVELVGAKPAKQTWQQKDLHQKRALILKQLPDLVPTAVEPTIISPDTEDWGTAPTVVRRSSENELQPAPKIPKSVEDFAKLPFANQLPTLLELSKQLKNPKALVPCVLALNPDDVRQHLNLITDTYKNVLIDILASATEAERNKTLGIVEEDRLAELRELIIPYIPSEGPGPEPTPAPLPERRLRPRKQAGVQYAPVESHALEEDADYAQPEKTPAIILLPLPKKKLVVPETATPNQRPVTPRSETVTMKAPQPKYPPQQDILTTVHQTERKSVQPKKVDRAVQALAETLFVYTDVKTNPKVFELLAKLYNERTHPEERALIRDVTTTKRKEVLNELLESEHERTIYPPQTFIDTIGRFFGRKRGDEKDIAAVERKIKKYSTMLEAADVLIQQFPKEEKS